MTKPVQVLVAVAAVVVILVGGLWLLASANQATSPEAKCQGIVQQLRDEGKGNDLTEDQWAGIYNDCVSRERSK